MGSLDSEVCILELNQVILLNRQMKNVNSSQNIKKYIYFE